MTCPGQGIIIDTGVPITVTPESGNGPSFNLESAGAIVVAPESPFSETITPERGILVLNSGAIDPCTSLVTEIALIGYNGQFFFDGNITFSAQRV